MIVDVWGPKTWITAVWTSYVYLSCANTLQSLLRGCKATTVINFIWVRLGVFEISSKIKGSVKDYCYTCLSVSACLPAYLPACLSVCLCLSHCELYKSGWSDQDAIVLSAPRNDVLDGRYSTHCPHMLNATEWSEHDDNAVLCRMTLAVCLDAESACASSHFSATAVTATLTVLVVVLFVFVITAAVLIVVFR